MEGGGRPSLASCALGGWYDEWERFSFGVNGNWAWPDVDLVLLPLAAAALGEMYGGGWRSTWAGGTRGLGTLGIIGVG